MLFFIYKRWLPPVRGRESTHRLIVFLRQTKFSVRDALLARIYNSIGGNFLLCIICIFLQFNIILI